MDVPLLKRIPVVASHNAIFWDAWEYFNARRPYNDAGPQFIPFSELRAYCGFYDMDRTDATDLITIVSHLDLRYMHHVREQKQKHDRDQQRKMKRGRRR